ncbi:MAG: hypothetical protein QG567_992 [Campylobacterota bacterium]|nr:hypothetical protein [Campylobacterota bacterium]
MQLNQLIVDENNMAFHPAMGNSYQVNDVAREIISFLKDGKTKEQIVENITEKYQADKKEVFIDVSDFLAKLKVYRLV